jgi:transcriptional regulator with XRE-family HTH domain
MPRQYRRTTATDGLGARIRQLRTSRRLSQEALGEILDVSFQQIQKYEKGTNSITSHRVVALCKALGVTPDQLYNTPLESKALIGLSAYAIRTATKLDKLSSEQRRVITSLLSVFGADDDEL